MTCDQTEIQCGYPELTREVLVQTEHAFSCPSLFCTAVGKNIPGVALVLAGPGVDGYSRFGILLTVINSISLLACPLFSRAAVYWYE